VYLTIRELIDKSSVEGVYRWIYQTLKETKHFFSGGIKSINLEFIILSHSDYKSGQEFPDPIDSNNRESMRKRRGIKKE